MTKLTSNEMNGLVEKLEEAGMDYDAAWSMVLFGGKDPNALYEKINKLYNAGEITSPVVNEKYRPGPDQYGEDI